MNAISIKPNILSIIMACPFLFERIEARFKMVVSKNTAPKADQMMCLQTNDNNKTRTLKTAVDVNVSVPGVSTIALPAATIALAVKGNSSETACRGYYIICVEETGRNHRAVDMYCR